MTTTPTWLRAAELNATHIGLDIRFATTLNRHGTVEAVITVELRQIGHNGGETHLTVGEGAIEEFTLTHDHIVVLNPAEDFSDWDLFSGADLRTSDRHTDFTLPEED